MKTTQSLTSEQFIRILEWIDLKPEPYKGPVVGLCVAVDTRQTNGNSWIAMSQIVQSFYENMGHLGIDYIEALTEIVRGTSEDYDELNNATTLYWVWLKWPEDRK